MGPFPWDEGVARPWLLVELEELACVPLGGISGKAGRVCSGTSRARGKDRRDVLTRLTPLVLSKALGCDGCDL